MASPTFDYGFEQSDEVVGDAFNWMHYTQAASVSIPYEPGVEVDEVHQYRKPIGGMAAPENAPSDK